MGRRGRAGGKPLVERGIGREVGVFIVVIEEGGDKGPIRVRIGGLGFTAGEAGAVDEEIAQVAENTRSPGSDQALGQSDWDFGEDSMDFFGRDDRSRIRDEVAGKIGGSEAADRGMGVGVAETVALGMSGLGAAAAVGKGEAAAGESERVLALARHRESITMVISIAK